MSRRQKTDENERVAAVFIGFSVDSRGTNRRDGIGQVFVRFTQKIGRNGRGLHGWSPFSGLV